MGTAILYAAPARTSVTQWQRLLQAGGDTKKCGLLAASDA